MCASANVMRTSSRGAACVYMFWRPLGYSACVCACSAYKFACFACVFVFWRPSDVFVCVCVGLCTFCVRCLRVLACVCVLVCCALRAMLRESVHVMRTSSRVLRVFALTSFGLFYLSLCTFCVQLCVCLPVFACWCVASFGLCCVSLCMFCVQVYVFCVCLRVLGVLRAILLESVHVLLTMLRVLLCVCVFWRPLGHPACVRVCSAYECAYCLLGKYYTHISHNISIYIYIY